MKKKLNCSKEIWTSLFSIHSKINVTLAAIFSSWANTNKAVEQRKIKGYSILSYLTIALNQCFKMLKSIIKITVFLSSAVHDYWVISFLPPYMRTYLRSLALQLHFSNSKNKLELSPTVCLLLHFKAMSILCADIFGFLMFNFLGFAPEVHEVLLIPQGEVILCDKLVRL